MKVELHLEKKYDTPIFRKARTVTYALSVAANEELQRLQEESIIKPVTSIKKVSPVVPVIKRIGENSLQWIKN